MSDSDKWGQADESYLSVYPHVTPPTIYSNVPFGGCFFHVRVKGAD